MNRYRREMKDLKRQNEELQAQLLHVSVERGQYLLAGQPSLAEELNIDDSTEVTQNLYLMIIKVSILIHEVKLRNFHHFS